MEPLISIVTPVYNSARYLSEAVESILNQSYNNWELWLIDDCSTDESFNVAERFASKDSRIQAIQLSENQGAAVARNEGIYCARGEYLAFLDSDDLWEPNKLAVQLAFMQDRALVFTFTGYTMMQNGHYIRPPIALNYKDLLKNTAIGCLTVMIDLRAVRQVHMPNVRAGQDTACWLQVLKAGHTAYSIDRPLAKYRDTENSISNNKLKALKRTWKIYREVEHLPIHRSAWYFSHYVKNALTKRILKGSESN